MKTISTEQTIHGEVIEFCNGLSLDFGEHPGLLIIKDSASEKTYNVILNPYKHYRYVKGDRVSVNVEPLTNASDTIEPMCKSVGDLFVKLVVSNK